jgi:hypothetical protein
MGDSNLDEMANMPEPMQVPIKAHHQGTPSRNTKDQNAAGDADAAGAYWAAGQLSMQSLVHASNCPGTKFTNFSKFPVKNLDKFLRVPAKGMLPLTDLSGYS